MLANKKFSTQFSMAGNSSQAVILEHPCQLILI